MKKKIIVMVILLLTMTIILVTALSLSKRTNDKSNRTDEGVVQKGKDSFRYLYSENFTHGKRWYLYINGNFTTYRFYPFEGFSSEKMKEHLSNSKLIKTVFDERNIRVYGVPLVEYESKYEIIYTVNDEDFYCWIKDVSNADKDSGAEKRLKELYKYVSEEELEKISEETWK